jgi:hypothetical protein
MESTFVDNIVVIFDPFLRFSPVFALVIFQRRLKPGDSPKRGATAQQASNQVSSVRLLLDPFADTWAVGGAGSATTSYSAANPPT